MFTYLYASPTQQLCQETWYLQFTDIIFFAPKATKSYFQGAFLVGYRFLHYAKLCSAVTSNSWQRTVLTSVLHEDIAKLLFFTKILRKHVFFTNTTGTFDLRTCLKNFIKFVTWVCTHSWLQIYCTRINKIKNTSSLLRLSSTDKTTVMKPFLQLYSNDLQLFCWFDKIDGAGFVFC